MALLEVNNIDVAYGTVTALRDVSLAVDKGERIALLGANGAGKSTTLRAISGLLAPKSGTITLDGEPVHGKPAYDVVKHGVSHGPEGRELFGALTVEENLRLGYWPQIKNGNKAGYKDGLERVYGMFPRLKERRNQEAVTMSGGEQQMLVMARALMSYPKLLMVDEMSLGLAPKIVSQLFEIIESVNEEGTAVIIVEQFVHMALSHTDRAYVLEKGRIAVEGTSQELLANPDVLAAYLGSETGEGLEADDTSTPESDDQFAPRTSATQTQTQAKTQAKTQTESKAQSKTKTQSQAQSKGKSQAKTQSKAQGKSKSKSGGGSRAKDK